MKYVDKGGNEILAGMTLQFPDGSTEEVYETEDQYGNPNLGINASNEDFLKYHGTDREYYSLSNFSAVDMEIMPYEGKIKVLIVEPMKAPRHMLIEQSLESLQKIVGGEIQEIMPFEENVCVICNVNGKADGLQPNRFIRDKSGVPSDILCGTFIVAGAGSENYDSLTDEQAEKYARIYEGDMLMPSPLTEKSTDKNIDESAKCNGYDIIERFRINEIGVVLGENPNAVSPYVTWLYRADSPNNFFWGKYFSLKTEAYENYMERIEHEVRYFENCTKETFTLPKFCLSVMPSSGDMINIMRGVSGYFPSDWNRPGDKKYNRETADMANEALGITKAQESAMLHGSMFGWNTKLADPKSYDDKGKLKHANSRTQKER